MWIPGYTKIDLGPDGGVYDETAHPKGELHTTEGTTLKGAEAAFKNYPPHIGYDPVRRIKHQYVALNRFSYANKGSESDDEFMIQVEIIGYAGQTHTWSNEVYRNIAVDVIKPLEELVGIPRQSRKFYRADQGIVLASPKSPIRLSNNELRNYSGWLGHQHIPSPDEHWDPGGFLIQKCFDYLELNMPDTPGVQDLCYRVFDFLQENETQTGGPNVNDTLPMVTNLKALVWRMEALINGRETVEGGPLAGEIVWPVRILSEMHTMLEQLTQDS